MYLPFCRNKRLLYIKSFYNKISANKVRSKYTVRLAFVDVHLFNNIFEMNKIEQMNCHVLFKQVHTMLCTCTLGKMRSQI